MQREKGPKQSLNALLPQREDKRVTTAPNKPPPEEALRRQDPPPSRKNTTRQARRNPKEDEREKEHEQPQKRPQTSKGSRGVLLRDSEFYEEDGEDLLGTASMAKKGREGATGKMQ